MKIRIWMIILVIIIGIGLVGTVYAIKQDGRSGIDWFEGIPEVPDDFDAYTRDIWKGAFVELCEIEEAYWKQPEFYGKSWEISKEKFYNNPDYSRWGVYGQGNLPSEIGYTFENLKKGDEFELCTFFHNGFGIWTYQGFQLVAEEEEYFDIEITPNVMTMSPTFPVFEDGWVRKINVKLIAKSNVPVGSYSLNINAVAPSDDYSRAETKRILKMVVDKDSYKEECERFLDTERCNYLINNREKKYISGGSYQSGESPLRILVLVK